MVRKVEVEKASKYFFYAAILNIVIASGSAAPILVPQLGLPLKLQIWPGTWMFIAFFSFIAVGVLGVLAWSVIYYLLTPLLKKRRVSYALFAIHLILFEMSVVSATALMGIFPGYVGGTLIHDGFGQLVVTRVIEWAVIPIGTLIAVAIIATLTGVLNIVFFSYKD